MYFLLNNYYIMATENGLIWQMFSKTETPTETGMSYDKRSTAQSDLVHAWYMRAMGVLNDRISVGKVVPIKPEELTSQYNNAFLSQGTDLAKRKFVLALHTILESVDKEKVISAPNSLEKTRNEAFLDLFGDFKWLNKITSGKPSKVEDYSGDAVDEVADLQNWIMLKSTPV